MNPLLIVCVFLRFSDSWIEKTNHKPLAVYIFMLDSTFLAVAMSANRTNRSQNSKRAVGSPWCQQELCCCAKGGGYSRSAVNTHLGEAYRNLICFCKQAKPKLPAKPVKECCHLSGHKEWSCLCWSRNKNGMRWKVWKAKCVIYRCPLHLG